MTMTFSRRRLLLGLAALPALATLSTRPVHAGEPPVYSTNGVAIDGTDPVAYFTEGRPAMGSASHEVTWNGATWRFMSAENAARFAADPAAYAPQFGGYCAWAAAEGYVASTQPDAWTIHEGKLYLNFNRRIRRRWERDIPGNIARGNANWPRLLK